MPQTAADDKLVLQGVVDAAFTEDGGLVLLDYKTGGAGKQESELTAQYRTQLTYYSQALAAIWQAPVREAWLYFLDLGQAVRVL